MNQSPPCCDDIQNLRRNRTMAESNTIRTIDVTPTWSGLLPGLLDVIRNGDTVEAQQSVEGELRKMARGADKYNLLARAYADLQQAEDGDTAAFFERIRAIFTSTGQ